MPVSVIIKTLNEEQRIAATIESALEAIKQIGGEVIVADSGSSDRTLEIASQYKVTIAQLLPPAQPSCGIGPQLGFQYSSHAYLCLLDGDMLLDPGFLPDAIAYLNANPQAGGVTGHVDEKLVTSLEYARRVTRNAPENRIGEIDRMNGGGLYRRAAIESVGYISDRNLHGYEEFDLGIRLRDAGWTLQRLDRRFVQHFGHTVNSYRLLMRRWRSKYLYGIGEFLRASVGKRYFLRALRELPELRLWAVVYAWWIAVFAILIFVPDKRWALLLAVASLGGVLLLASVAKRSLSMGLYTVVAWFFHAAALPIGFLGPRRNPASRVESRIVAGAKE